jgi:hypothetical protein
MAKNNYTTGKLIGDVLLTFLTGGLWLIVVAIRFAGRNS